MQDSFSILGVFMLLGKILRNKKKAGNDFDHHSNDHQTVSKGDDEFAVSFQVKQHI